MIHADDKLIIDRIDVYQVNKEIPKPYRLSWGTIDRFFGFVFELHAGGCTGVGEGLTGEKKLAVETARCLIGRDAGALGSLLPDLAVENQEVRAVREGLTFALYDLVGKYRRQPVWTLLSGMKRKEFHVRPVVFIEKAEEMADEVGRMVEAGFTGVKIKFSGKIEEDFTSLSKVRRTFGPSLDIQADANMGYKTEGEFLRLVEKIQGLDLSIIEDPCWLSNNGYAQLRRKLKASGIRLMLDEPVRTVMDIRMVCAAGAADIINQHPNCQGGPDFLAEGQRIARAAGLENMIGGITGYFGIGDVGYYSAAAAIGTGFVEQTPTQMYQGLRLSRNPHPIVDGKVTLDASIIGCGVELDREMLKQVLVDRIGLGR